MKVLLIHADSFKYEVKEMAIKEPEKISEPQKKHSVSEVLVAFCAVEKPDEEHLTDVSEKAAKSVEEVARWVKARNVVIYPYAHLSSNLASPGAAISLLDLLKGRLTEQGYAVTRAPFGWYKSFELSCKGHPLSELSRSIVGEEVKPVQPPVKHVYRILTPSMQVYNPSEYSFKAGEDDFRSLVEKEALRKELAGGVEPRYLAYCKKFGVGWEPFSDLGHMRYGPEANLMFELIVDYAGMLVDSLGIPVYRVRGTNMFDLSVPAVREHANLFGGRLYELKSDGKHLLLRYAACHQQFAMIKDWVISYKDLPMGAYELADSYRLEQEGELLLCFRVRKLHMPDLHIFCKSLEEAQEYSLKVHRKIYEEVEKLGRDYVSLYNTTEGYFEKNREFFRQLMEVEEKPVLLCFVPEMYYWVLNVEYNVVDELGRPREIATFQIDVGNSKRFGISYIDEGGSKVHPVIIHTAILGTVERYLFTIFDSIVRDEKAGKPPTLPLWLTPTQARIIPVSRNQLDLSMEMLKKLEEANVRVDLDDCDETVSKRVRKAETSWVPYILVVGEEEAKTGKVDLRFREDSSRRKVTLDEVIKGVKERTQGYPWKTLTLPKLISRRPVY